MPCNLLLHCGSDAVPREELSKVRTPAPTRTWQPIPHPLLLHQVEAALPRYGMRVVSQAHGLSHDGNRYFGLLEVANGSNHPDFSRVLGIRNSHDKRFPAGLVLGNQVLVCDNLSFSGEIKVARKHTTFILNDLPHLIDDGVCRLRDSWHEQDRRIEDYQRCQMRDPIVHDLTIHALDRGIICGSQVPKVLQEYREPRHDAFRPRTLWSWFNACTETLKGNLGLLPARTQRLHLLCDAHAGLN
ncbi:MAG: DUF932 domain-containing protein [Opitutales bacterium]